MSENSYIVTECLSYFEQVLDWINSRYDNIALIYRLFTINSSVHLEIKTVLFSSKHRKVISEIYKYLVKSYRGKGIIEANYTEKLGKIALYAICKPNE